MGSKTVSPNQHQGTKEKSYHHNLSRDLTLWIMQKAVVLLLVAVALAGQASAYIKVSWPCLLLHPSPALPTTDCKLKKNTRARKHFEVSPLVCLFVCFPPGAVAPDGVCPYCPARYGPGQVACSPRLCQRPPLWPGLKEKKISFLLFASCAHICLCCLLWFHSL